ncbi:hypothetical protein [Fictibacillus phosphorivorans]|uniref:hypothetical protein n=1 Tax=Fictibacillus phosphorivorans TaxID=1221500 RepID=UPI00203B9C43|nr:hypothetical protein [Fictibacillus phosphorivorans]MCM3720227.1 hypothetical protein [Fictibacillus phosphorivorans]MCM3777928.1 hypothetical protein [Fictibacillus phosphorivorans]
MLHVNVKTKDIKFSIPVPYILLNIGISILTSKVLIRHANKWSKPHLEKKKIPFTIPSIDKRELKTIIKELKNHKGLELVNVKAEDGTEVIIKL